MNNKDKFQKKLYCICQNMVFFEIIPEIECDWGSHIVIQCPKCEELFSIDKKCPAFQTIELLLKQNIGLFSNEEQLSYSTNCHSC
mgnify:FL=1|jgi:hypothetical protein|tara:strand:- start:150 stop:404 length:255 start_codon:yes stop_codon:yes gene_type:complete